MGGAGGRRSSYPRPTPLARIIDTRDFSRGGRDSFYAGLSASGNFVRFSFRHTPPAPLKVIPGEARSHERKTRAVSVNGGSDGVCLLQNVLRLIIIWKIPGFLGMFGAG